MHIYLFIVFLLLLIYYLWNQSNEIKMYYFYKPDCKYCKEMTEDWNHVEKKLCGSGILYKKFDITDPRFKKIKYNFNVKTVPHIVKINKNGTRNIFDGKRKCDDIISWVYENYD